MTGTEPEQGLGDGKRQEGVIRVLSLAGGSLVWLG